MGVSFVAVDLPVLRSFEARVKIGAVSLNTASPSRPVSVIMEV
jgi:hypothetical protein